MIVNINLEANDKKQQGHQESLQEAPILNAHN
jgi:hypothetical protein